MKKILNTVLILVKVFGGICMMMFVKEQSPFAFGAATISESDGQTTAMRDEENQKVIIIRGSPPAVSDTDM